MWIVYDTRTGVVVDGPNTSSAWPDEVPEGAALANVKPADKPYAEVMTFHDEEDAEEIAGIFELATTNELLVVDGVVVAGELHPPIPPAPPTEGEVLEGRVEALEQRVEVLEQQVETLLEVQVP